MTVETILPVLLFILVLGLIIPELFKKFRLPLLTVIIISGSIFGPFGLGYIQLNETITFLGFLGITFLMFSAGLETNTTILKHSRVKIFIMALMNGGIPFLVGLIITRFFGYSWLTSILIGVVFISSSVAVIIPSLNGTKVKENVKQMILATIVITDIVSLVALGFIFQNESQITNLPLPLYYIILIFSILILLFFIPKISDYIINKRLSVNEGYERKIRFIVIFLIGILIYFSILGVHPILASFLAGLSLSKIVKKDKTGAIKEKLHTLGFGMFIPVFFFIVGMEMDLSLLKNFDITNILMLSLIVGLIFSKFFSGYVSGRIVNFTNSNSLLFGSISIVQLTTTLAVVFAASNLGLIDSTLTTSIIILSISTTILGPILASHFVKK